MAATSGLGALGAVGSATNLASDLLAHITPTSTAVATTITITGPLQCRLLIAVVKNDDTWTTAGTTECNDANYTRQSVTAWNAQAKTSGSGYNVGVVTKTSNVALTFGGGSGFAVTQTITGVALTSSDATPIQVAYENFASSQVVNAGNQFSINSGSLSVGLS